MQTKTKSTVILVESAVMLALATVLSLIKVFEAPLGGSITLLSMLPICLISVRYGIKWGLGTAFCHSLIQLFLGLGSVLSWGLTPAILIGCFVLDYLLAYTVIGFAGLFRKKGALGILLGTAFALALRFVSHFISGFILWTNLDQWEIFQKTFENRPLLYSAVYNGFYMLPELILTVGAMGVLLSIPVTKKMFRAQD